MSANDVRFAEQQLRTAEALLKFAQSRGNPDEIRVANERYLAKAADLEQIQEANAGTPPARSVNPAVSPEASQVESSIAEDYGIPANFAETAQPINTFDDQLAAFLDEPDPPVQPAPSPAPPTQDPEVTTQTTNRRARTQVSRVREREPETPAQDVEVNEQQSNRERAQDARVAEPEDPAEDSVVSNQQRNRARAQAARVAEREPEDPTEDAEVNEQKSNRERAQAARVAEREPEDPTEDAEVNKQKSNRERAQDQRIENADAEDLNPLISPAAAKVDSTVSKRAQAQLIRQDSIVKSDPTSYESLTDEQLQQQRASTKAALDRLDALPTQQRLQVQAQIDALEDQLDLLDKESGRRATRGRLEGQVERGKRAPAPVDINDTGFKPPLDPEEPENFPPEPEAQINSAALERLKAQAAIKQNRDPESTGDWRVKLRLASGSSYLYKLAQQEGTTGGAGQNLGAGILTPLVATDGVIFPYTPRISTLYSAEYNVYNPTHSNYNQYWYKGSKVGEVQLDATFTAQDTQEADYMLAVIHFFKSASKMFYGQDPNRGSPPPLLFLTGLGQYQYNEHPCVISQFNYILPDDVDYIRAGAPQINGQTDTLQYNLRNKNTNGGPVWAGSTTRRLINGLSPGAEPTRPRSIVNLNSSEATYVPTKIQVSLVLLPVNNRLQISQNFNLSEYGNGNLLKGGMW